MNICLRCGYQWEGRVEKPKNCPHCKAARWDKVPNPVGRPKEEAKPDEPS